MITENLSTLKIHKLTQEQYNRELKAGRVDPNAIYLTPDENENSIYIQNDEPIDVPDGSLWVDLNGQGSGSGGITGSGSNSSGSQSQPINMVEPVEDDMPKVFFGSALPQTKDDTIMSFRYISKTRDISGYCKTKAQGNSSMAFPKKNQTVKLYKDADCTEKLKVDFKGWGKQNKFCFKANWVDLTHARNIVSARLWGDVVKSRANYAEIPEELRTSPNQGAVDGFPVKVYANGIYQGRYTINIPKDAWMANMDDELDEHCILCGENYVSSCFRAEANIDESDWTDEIHDAVPAAIKNRWNEAIRFVMNSTDSEFISGIGNYFDLESLIDYYIFGLLICNMDGFGKNQLYHTYDGLKWYATVYDMDCTFGTYFDLLLPYNYARTSFEDFKGDDRNGNLLYIRLEELFIEAIQQRYIELIEDALSLTNIINRFERFTDIAPMELVKEDYAVTTVNGEFINIPLKDSNNIQQIRNYIVARYPYVYNYIFGLGSNGNLLYRLPEETTLDGVDDYIDTGVKLFDTAKDFTIICDATLNGAEASEGIYSCYQNDNGGIQTYGGICCTTDIYSGENYLFRGFVNTGGGEVFNETVNSTIVKHAVVYTMGIPTAMYYITENGGILHEASPVSGATYLQQDTNLILGCRFGWYQSLEGFCPATFRNFEVWDYAMSEEEIEEKLGITDKPDTGNLLYRLPQETIFDGVDDFINTGLYLFKEPKDFTIVCDATLAEAVGDYCGIYTAYLNDNGGQQPNGGLQCLTLPEQTYGIGAAANTPELVSVLCNVPYTGSLIVKHVLVVKAGIPRAIYYVTENGGAITMLSGNPPECIYRAHENPLALGCTTGWWQTPTNFAAMTMHNFEVWDYAMSENEAREKLA